MKKLLVLFFVAAMCVPSYGAHDILVYTTSTTATIFDLTAATRSVETKKGFLVIDIDLATGVVDTAQHVTYSGTSQQTEDVDVEFFDDVAGYIVGTYEDDDYYAEVYGTAAQTDVGFGAGNKKLVATSLSGHLVANADNCFGSGIVSATLDTVRTKAANAAVDPIDDVVDDIVAYLVTKNYFYPGYIQAQIDAAVAGRAGEDVLVTVLVPAGTYAESLDIHHPNVTLKSVSGKAATTIAPGADGQGVIEIGGEHVTIDGFTIRQGTQAYDADNPQEHTIWVYANYSTIKNCTIIGARGNQACIFIGDRDDTVADTYLRRYNDGTPSKGHTIQNNKFRYGTATAGSGEGWGIWAYNLTDDCLIKGNTFDGDAADVGHWNANEGGPGTGILIHNATNGDGTNAVIIEENTAQYLQYSWLTFYAAFPYNDSLIPGKFYEQQEDSAVEDVIVRNNTIQNLGKNALHESGVAVTFKGTKKDQSYDPGTADLDIGAGGVTIRNNTFCDNACGVCIDGPTNVLGGRGCVHMANNITIGPGNRISAHFTDGEDDGAGVYNGTIEEDQEGGPKLVTAEYNWWGSASGPYTAGTHPGANLTGTGNQVSDYVDYSPYWRKARLTHASAPLPE